jgi:hypothetical protein
MPRVRNARLVHLVGEPLSAVHADLDRKREPGLNAGVQEAEERMNGVVVQEQALADAGLELQVFGVAVAVDLKGAARLDAGQHTHQALSDAIFNSDAAGDVLLTGFGRCQVADRSASRHRLRQRRGLQPLADLLDVCAEVLEQNVITGQVVLHARGVCDGPQRAAEHQSIKT